MLTDAPLPSLTDRFVVIMEGLCRAVAAASAHNRDSGPILLLIWGRLRRVMARFARIDALVRAGTLPVPRPRGPRARTGVRPPWTYVPWDWVLRRVPGSAAFGSQLQHFLAQPETAALIAAAPQLARTLRPLCRMLAVPPYPPVLPPPPARRAATMPPANATPPLAPPLAQPGPSAPEPPDGPHDRPRGHGLTHGLTHGPIHGLVGDPPPNRA